MRVETIIGIACLVGAVILFGLHRCFSENVRLTYHDQKVVVKK